MISKLTRDFKAKNDIMIPKIQGLSRRGGDEQGHGFSLCFMNCASGT